LNKNDFLCDRNKKSKIQKMNIKKIIKPLILSLFIGLMFLASCKKEDIKSPSELYAEEMAILEKFKETDTYKNWFDEAELALDSSDAEGRYHGLVYFQLKKGYLKFYDENNQLDSVMGDTVLLGKSVGIRYNMYYIMDSVGAEEPYLVKVGSNMTKGDPINYRVGNPDPSQGIYQGIDLGVRFMNAYGESRILFPSNLGGNDYISRVVEVKITYMGR